MPIVVAFACGGEAVIDGAGDAPVCSALASRPLLMCHGAVGLSPSGAQCSNRCIDDEGHAIDSVCDDLAELAAAVARGLLPVAHERNVALDVHTRPVELEVDEPKLRCVIENLLSNALKFTDEGGRVSLRVHHDGKTAEVRITDTGIGIDEQHREKIFERYYRAGARRPGTGVGLSIVRDLVHLHGGELTVESRPGEGSAFTVRLPRKAA